MIFCLLMLPFLLQGGVFFLDEFVYHRKRGLPLWERIGHPIDTASIIAALLYAAQRDFTRAHVLVFAGLAVFSCVLVTKDEFVHAELCEPREQWLHSLLFVLHPLLFVTIGILWYQGSIGASPIPAPLDLSQLLFGQIAFLALIMIYQITYWSFLWQPRKSRSTTTYTIRSAIVGTAQKMIP